MLSFPHSLANNNLAGETGYVKKSKVQGSSFEVGAKVTYEGREMTVSKAPDRDGDIKMIDLSGFMALAASLPECGLTSLKCAAAPSVRFVSAPIDTPTLSPPHPAPCFAVSAVNHIGAEGASALAAILKETQITTLKCAAALECSLLCQRPLTRLSRTFPAPCSQSRGQRASAPREHRSREGLKGNSTLQSLK